MTRVTLPRTAALCALAAALSCLLLTVPAQATASGDHPKAGKRATASKCSRRAPQRRHAKQARKKAARNTLARLRCARLVAKRVRDRTAPSVAFTAPAGGATVGGVLAGDACVATAADNGGVDRVEFSVDGVALNIERVVPYNCVWDTAGVAPGTHVLKARAVDAAGNAGIASVSVTVAAPAPVPVSEPAPAPAPAPAPTDPAPAPSGPVPVGMHASLHWLGQADIAARLDKLKAAGVTYVREDFQWNLVEGTRGTYNWAAYDRLMREAAMRGISVMAIPNSPPSWATASTSTPPLSGDALTGFTTFVRKAIERYGSQGGFWAANPSLPKVPIVMWDIWNEPWGFWSWGPSMPDGGVYARWYAAVVQAVRGVDPAARFMADIETRAVGPSTLTPFLHQMFDAVPDLGRYMDAVSVHPYPDSTAPTTCTPNTPSKGIYEDWKATMFQFCRLKDVRSILDARGAAGTRIWVTEIGFSTAASASRTVTETQQAQYVHDVFRLLRGWDMVDGMLWYRYDDYASQDPTDREAWFGLVRANGSAKPAWSAFLSEVATGL